MTIVGCLAGLQHSTSVIKSHFFVAQLKLALLQCWPHADVKFLFALKGFCNLAMAAIGMSTWGCKIKSVKRMFNTFAITLSFSSCFSSCLVHGNTTTMKVSHEIRFLYPPSLF